MTIDASVTRGYGYEDNERFSDDNIRRLVESVKKGDLDALEELSAFSYKKIYPYVFYRVRQREDAEDITSTVIIKMARAIKEQHGHFMAWLYRIASNAVIDFYRKRSRTQEISLHDMKTEIPDPKTSASSDLAEVTIKREKLREALKTLTPEQADVIAHRFIADESIDETAKIMKKSAGAVKLLQYRALHALKNYFRKIGYDIKK